MTYTKKIKTDRKELSMYLEKFEHQVRAGEITDFEPYFENDSFQLPRDTFLQMRYRKSTTSSKYGPGTILGFIDDRVHTDRYEEWKKSSIGWRSKALARAELFPRRIHSWSDALVRRVVIEKDIMPRGWNDYDKEDEKTSNSCWKTASPDVDLLSAYIDTTSNQNTNYDYPSLRTKLNSRGYVTFQRLSKNNEWGTVIRNWLSPLDKPYTANRILGIVQLKRKQ